MKVVPTADYPVQVLRQAWEEEPAVAHLYDGAYAVSLNHVVKVAFIPDVSPLAPPWDADALTALLEVPQEAMTPIQAQVFSALSASYVITPSAGLADRDETFRWPAGGGEEDEHAVFYIDPPAYARYAAELDALTEVASDASPDQRVSDLRHHPVIAFLERRVVASDRLIPRHAVLLGRT